MSSIDNILERRDAVKRKRKQAIKSDVLNIGVYIRVSTKEQAKEGLSLSAQKTIIEKYIEIEQQFENKVRNLFLFKDEGKSGKDLNRTGLKQMIAYVENRTLNNIVVVKLDRLTRNLENLQHLIYKFNKYNVNLLSIKEKLDTDSATGRFFISILGSLAQLEREQVSERVYDVFKEMIGQRHVGSKAPFGYVHVPSQPFGFYIPHLPEYCEKYDIPPIIAAPAMT